MLFLYVGVIVTSALAMTMEGYTGVGMIILILLFESGIFSLIFAMCIRGLGAHTKMGSVALTASTSGGAVIPAIMSPVTNSRGLRYSFAVVVAVFAFGSLLPIYTTVVPAAKDQVDPVYKSKDAQATGGSGAKLDRASRVLSVSKRKDKNSAEMPWTEHTETDKEKEPG